MPDDPEVFFNSGTGLLEVRGRGSFVEPRHEPVNVYTARFRRVAAHESAGWGRATFDDHQFAGKRVKAVSNLTGLSFSDYERMHTERRQSVLSRGWRRKGIPDWTMSDEKFRKVLVNYLEKRFYLAKRSADTSLTLEKRLERAVRAAQFRLPDKKRNLDLLLDVHANIISRDRRHLEALNPGVKIAVLLRSLETVIQGLDSDILFITRGAAELCTAVTYFSFRMHMNSVDVAEALQIKPPHVRQLLFRLCHTARALGMDETPRAEHKIRRYVRQSVPLYRRLRDSTGDLLVRFHEVKVA